MKRTRLLESGEWESASGCLQTMLDWVHLAHLHTSPIGKSSSAYWRTVQPEAQESFHQREANDGKLTGGATQTIHVPLAGVLCAPVSNNVPESGINVDDVGGKLSNTCLNNFARPLGFHRIIISVFLHTLMRIGAQLLCMALQQVTKVAINPLLHSKIIWLKEIILSNLCWWVVLLSRGSPKSRPLPVCSAAPGFHSVTDVLTFQKEEHIIISNSDALKEVQNFCKSKNMKRRALANWMALLPEEEEIWRQAKEWDTDLCKQERNTALFVDNCNTHYSVQGFLFHCYTFSSSLRFSHAIKSKCILLNSINGTA